MSEDQRVQFTNSGGSSLKTWKSGVKTIATWILRVALGVDVIVVVYNLARGKEFTKSIAGWLLALLVANIIISFI